MLVGPVVLLVFDETDQQRIWCLWVAYRLVPLRPQIVQRLRQ